ncbi:hypothetical protein BDR26DRAFT_373217 [Obelidium mucronatum]|nr:hypothetical protein BDR26DRAFT_373217 [Obelidium mucronatum]
MLWASKFLAIAAGTSLALPVQHSLGSISSWKENGYRLISTAPGKQEWMSELDILNLYQTNTRFIDRTDHDVESYSTLTPPKKYAPPKKPSHQDLVEPLFSNISIPLMTEWLTTFTSFKTRYYQSPSGKEAVEWLYSAASTVAKKASPNTAVTITKFTHQWSQFSVILRFEKASGVRNKPKEHEPVVILSAHSDSINQINPYFGRSPGAEDDGSGCATIFEVFRILVESDFVPKRPIEFHWYSAEEAGLLGSQKVASQYQKDGVNVAGVWQADETGYIPKGKEPVIGISGDFVDNELEEFLRRIVKVYVPDVKIVDTECGYACSDHASWTEAGFPSSYLFDTRMEDGPPFSHTSTDDLSRVSFDHIARFVRVGLGFAVELSLAN